MQPLLAVVVVAASLVALTGCTQPSPEPSGTVTVLADVALTDAFTAAADSFEQAHPDVRVELVFDESDALAVRLRDGGPADLFASADDATMQRAVAAGSAVDPVVIATDTLQIVVQAGNPAHITGVVDLADESRRIALCDPAVPCGAEGETVIHLAGYQPAPDSLDRDVHSVLARIVDGSADAGLAWATEVRAAGNALEGIDVPEAADAPTRYPVALVEGAPNAVAAHAFLEYLLGDGRVALTDAGFAAP